VLLAESDKGRGGTAASLMLSSAASKGMSCCLAFYVTRNFGEKQHKEQTCCGESGGVLILLAKCSYN